MLDFQRASSSLKYPPTKSSQMSEAARRIFAPSSLVTSRVLVADASPSGGGRGQLRRSPFPSLMRLRHPGVKLEHKGHIYFTIVDFFIIQNGCYRTVAIGTINLLLSDDGNKFIINCTIFINLLFLNKFINLFCSVGRFLL